jgi:hypothetical protein
MRAQHELARKRPLKGMPKPVLVFVVNEHAFIADLFSRGVLKSDPRGRGPIEFMGVRVEFGHPGFVLETRAK